MTNPTISVLTHFDRAEYQALAERVATGPYDNGKTRALVVVNPTAATLSGQALFPVDMPWPRDRAFPPISVVEALTERPVLFELLASHWALYEDGDPRGREDMQRLRFTMTINVDAVPPLGYATYIASFTEIDNPPASPVPVGPIRPELVVVETLSHPGELKPAGSLIAPATAGLVVQWSSGAIAEDGSVHIVVSNNSRSAIIGVLRFAVAIQSASRIDRNETETPLAPPDAGIRLALPRIGAGESIFLRIVP